MITITKAQQNMYNSYYDGAWCGDLWFDLASCRTRYTLRHTKIQHICAVLWCHVYFFHTFEL